MDRVIRVDAGIRITGVLVVILIGLAMMPAQLVHPYLLETKSSLRRTSSYRVDTVYGLSPPSITVVDPGHTVGYVVSFIVMDPISLKLQVIGSITGSGTSFLPDTVIRGIESNIMKWVMNNHYGGMAVSLLSLISAGLDNNNDTNATLVPPPKLVPLDKIRVPLIILTNIYEPVNNTCVKIYTVASTIALDTEKIAEGQKPSIIIRVDTGRLHPTWIIRAQNPITPGTLASPGDILSCMRPYPIPGKIRVWMNRLAFDITIKEYFENDTVAPLVWVWHGNTVEKGVINVWANITPIDGYLYFYADIESPSAGDIVSRFLGISIQTITINNTFNISTTIPEKPGCEPGCPAIVFSGIEGRIVHAEITVTPATPLYRDFFIREEGFSKINMTFFIPYMAYYPEPQGWALNLVSIYAWINQTADRGVPERVLMTVEYNWYYYLKSITGGLKTMYSFNAGKSFYLSYGVNDAILATYYYSILGGEINRHIHDFSHSWCVLGRVNVKVSVLERSEEVIGRVTVYQLRQGDVIDMLMVSSGPLWSNVSLTGLSSPG